MRRFLILPVLVLAISFLSGCNQFDKLGLNQTEEKPMTMVTPKGYSKPVPIGSAVNMSWEKKALLAMIAPSIAEQIEKTHSGLKAPAPVAKATPATPVAKIAKHSARKSSQRVAMKNRKKASKQVASARKASHAIVATKF